VSDDRGRSHYHDPTSRWGGEAPSYSALTLRLVLACFGVVSCTVAAAVFAWVGVPTWLVVVAVLLVVVAAVDAVVVVRRKRRGEPG
jgi:cytochrome c biogenesis factor